MGGPPRLIVLGSGTAVPRADRATSCYLVDDGAGTVLLVDCGPGALHRAAAAGYPLPSLDVVLVTHIHPDHCADLVALQFAVRGPLGAPRPRPVLVFGDPAVALLVSRLRNAWPEWLAPKADRFELRTVAPGPVALPGRTTAAAFKVAHHASSLGWRLTLPDGFTLAFSGDATEGADLLALGRDADLFVIEAAVPARSGIPGHLDPARAGRVGAACGAKALLLTHFYPSVLAQPIASLAQQGFEGRVTLAQDGMVVPLTR